MFLLSPAPLDPQKLCAALRDPRAGALVTFEGWVRNHNEGREVTGLEYEAYAALAEKEGQRILARTHEQFDILHAACLHRVGKLELGDLAVYVGVSAAHRDAAFAACRHIIDEVKARVPIWKKEFYLDGNSGWVNCPRCAEHLHHV